jgi:hypothetical protein
MKSYADFALDIYESILRDALTRWPTLKSLKEKDLSYLRKIVKIRGLPFFTEILPAVGKFLDRSLDNGCLLSDEYPQGYPLLNGRPKLFRDLLSQVFDTEGLLRDDADLEAILFLRTLCYCMKKILIPYNAPQLEDTLDEFFLIEKRLPPSYPDTWDSDIPVWTRRYGHPLWGWSTADREALASRDLFLDGAANYKCPFNWDHFQAFARRCSAEIGSPDWWGIVPKHGPGAVAETGKPVKYEFVNWSKRLQLFFPFDWFGSGSLDENQDWPTEKEVSSRLVAVPKTPKGPRLICCEPISNQWIQQGILGWLEERIGATLFRHSINLRSQELSKQRALSASIDGREVTIDLSSASDRISTRLVEYLFWTPVDNGLLDGLHACRTRTMTQNLSSRQPSMVVLKKFSTMGSALTFPIQSMLFAMLAVYALRHTEGRTWNFEGLEDDFRRVRVFGDDIIAPKHAYEAIELLLQECGLKVNTSKTYTGFNFRESCGCDAFKGVDVTPPRILSLYDGSPASTATTIETSNNFHKKGMWRTAEMLVSQLPESERKLLLVHDGGGLGLGLYSFTGPSISHLKQKWDADLQRYYSIALGVTSKVTKRQGTGAACLTQYFTESPDPRFPWASGQVGRARLKKGRVRVYG